MLLIVLVLPTLLKAQIKHPYEVDLSDLENDDSKIMKMTNKRTSSHQVDCTSYYRRLVKHVFNEKRFRIDTGSDYFVASIPIRVNKEQYELLVNGDGLNLNEVDDLIADVLKQSNDDEWNPANLLYEHYRHEFMDKLPSLSSPFMQIIIAIGVIILLNRLFHFSKLTFSAIILFVFLVICAVSYSMTYFDCLSDLEVDQMIQLAKQQSTNNPCKDYHGERKSFWSSMRATAFGSSENKCLDHMRATLKQTKKFCDPLDVFAKWAATIQMTYLSSVFGGFLNVVTDMTASSGFLTKIIYTLAVVAVFVLVLLTLGKAVIKYGFKGFVAMLTTSKVTTEPTSHSSVDYQILHSKIDEILHENLQMKRELSIIRECSVERSLPAGNSSPKKIEAVSILSKIHEETAP